ncbi:hypothetical protein ACVJGD_004626 [Bradyrhizobium sp. USDA 10063]
MSFSPCADDPSASREHSPGKAYKPASAVVTCSEASNGRAQAPSTSVMLGGKFATNRSIGLIGDPESSIFCQSESEVSLLWSACVVSTSISVSDVSTLQFLAVLIHPPTLAFPNSTAPQRPDRAVDDAYVVSDMHTLASVLRIAPWQTYGHTSPHISDLKRPHATGQRRAPVGRRHPLRNGAHLLRHDDFSADVVRDRSSPLDHTFGGLLL